MNNDVKKTQGDKEYIDPFVASQPVWLIDTNQVEIDKITNSLAPEVIHYNYFEDLIDAMSQRFQLGQDATGTLIVTQNLPADIKAKYDTLVNTVNKFKTLILSKRNNEDHLTIFEINAEAASSELHQFIDSILCKNVDDFLIKAHNRRFQSITNNANVDEDTQILLKQLQNEVDKQQKINEVLRDKNDKLSKDKQEVQDQLNLLNNQINSFKHQSDSAKKALADIKEEKDKVDIDNKAKQKEIDDLTKVNNDYRDKIAHYNIDQKSSNDYIVEARKKISYLEMTNNDLNNELTQLQDHNKEILKARNDLEANDVLQQRNNALLEDIKKLNKQIFDLKEKNNVLQLQKDELVDTNNNIRKGYVNVNRIGYSNNFAKLEFTNTDILYFKVINSLPFHRFYLKELLKAMKLLFNEDVNSISLDLKIIFYRVDFGNDKQIIGKYPVIANLGSVEDDQNEIYCLMPNLKDNENIDQFEKTRHHIIIFIDYIDNNQYYANTKGLIDYYNIVREDQTAYDLKLRGRNISYDYDSLVNLKYNHNFVIASDKVKQKKIIENLSSLIKSSSVISNKINNN